MKLLNQKVLPAILDPLGQQLGQIFAQILQADIGRLGGVLPTQKELDRIVRGVAAEQMIRPTHVRQAAGAVRALSATLGSPQAQTALQGVRERLRPQEVWPEDVAVQVSLEILRLSGHKWIDSDLPGGGAFVANLAVSTVANTKDTAGNVAQAVCGLIPEVGGAVCAVFKQIVEVAYNYAIPEAMKVTISTTMHNSIDFVMDETKKAYLQGRDPRALRQNLGPFKAVVDAFPTKQVLLDFAVRDQGIREMHMALFEYNESVRALAEIAVGRR
jgi:hypothetical protein